MFSKKNLQNLVLIGAISGALLLSVGCTKHPNEDQIRVMEETRSAALSAEQKLEDMKQQRKQLENQLAKKKQDQEQCAQDKADVEARLQNWQE